MYLIRQQIPDNAWLNTIVFFEESDYIETENDNVWFNNINDLISYIVNDGKAASENNANAFFEKSIVADYIYSKSYVNSLQCIVCNDSLRFTTANGTLDRRNIHSISISHHWSYDEVKITTRDEVRHIVNIENGSIYVIDNGYKYRYALCKLDYILLGN